MSSRQPRLVAIYHLWREERLSSQPFEEAFDSLKDSFPLLLLPSITLTRTVHFTTSSPIQCNPTSVRCDTPEEVSIRDVEDDKSAVPSSLYENVTPFVGISPPLTQEKWEQIRDLASRIE